MKTAKVITGGLEIEFPNLNDAVRYVRTSLTFEGLKVTHILWEGRKITSIRPSYGDYGETKKSRPYGVSSPNLGTQTTTHKTLQEAVLAANSGQEVYSWREGTHRVRMLVHII